MTRSKGSFAKSVRRVVAKAERSKASWISLLEPATGSCFATRLTPFPNDLGCPNVNTMVLLPGSPSAAAPVFQSQWDQTTEGIYLHRLDLTLYIEPDFAQGTFATPAQQFQAMQRLNTMVRVGMVKQRWEADPTGAFDFNVYNPLQVNDLTTATTIGDYIDGPFMRIWEHMFQPQVSFTQHFEPQSCCPNVHGGSQLNVLENGSGTIDTSISTDCNPCGMGENFFLTDAGFGPFFNQTVTNAKPWKLRIHVPFKRRLHFKEADALHLFFGWENQGTAATFGQRAAQPDLNVWGVGRALVSR